jgi:hypothetical protein
MVSHCCLYVLNDEDTRMSTDFASTLWEALCNLSSGRSNYTVGVVKIQMDFDGAILAKQPDKTP